MAFCAAKAGFICGCLRALFILGWVLPAAKQPIVAGALVSAWIGMIHAVAALVGIALMNCKRLGVPLIAAATVPALDWVISNRQLLPIPYLTTVFAIAAPTGMGVLAAFGWAGLSSTCGIMGLSMAMSLEHAWRGAVLALALLAVTVTALIANPHEERDSRGRRLQIVAIRSGTNLRQWNKSKATPKQQPDLVILPEEELMISTVPGTNIHSDTSATLDDLGELRVRCPNAQIISGVMIISDADDDRYRNSVLLMDNEGRYVFRDKCTPAPGGEQVPFQGIPVLNDQLRRVFGVEGTMITTIQDRQAVALGSLRVATAVCFEHTLPDSTTAWGVSRGEADILVAVACLSRLDDAADVDIMRSQPARRLHSACLAAPVVYVTDIGVELVTTDGCSSFAGYEPDGIATIVVNTEKQMYSRWPLLMLLLVLAGATMICILSGDRMAFLANCRKPQ